MSLPARYERPIIPLRDTSLFPKIAPMVRFYHPSIERQMLALPANDVSSTPNVFGLHRSTALLACQVLACNELGYLSTSSDREDISAQRKGDRDSLLLERKYYYHLDTPNPQYEICQLFSEWKFPHKTFPKVWGSAPLNPDIGLLLQTDIASAAIKGRDNVCAISGCNDSLTMAHIVPIAHDEWLTSNEMDAYMRGNDPPHLDPRNLMAMRGDLHHQQFDQGTFAIVPKCGELRVHFLKNVYNAGNHYHNTLFSNNNVSPQLLFARFAMQIINLRNYQTPARIGGHTGDDESRPAETHPQKRAPDAPATGPLKKRTKTATTGRDVKKSGNDNPRVATRARWKEEGESGVKGKGKGKAVAKDEDEIDSEDTEAGRERDRKELARDKKLAARTVSFFVDDSQPDKWSYEYMTWYPGVASVRRLKERYLRGHPQVRAHSSATAKTASDDGSLKAFDSD